MKLEICDRFSKNPQISNFMKIRRVGAELFLADGRTNRQTDRQTDLTKLAVAFRNFANAPKSPILTLYCVTFFVWCN
jgi:hypothetical protein